MIECIVSAVFCGVVSGVPAFVYADAHRLTHAIGGEVFVPMIGAYLGYKACAAYLAYREDMRQKEREKKFRHLMRVANSVKPTGEAEVSEADVIVLASTEASIMDAN